MRYPSCLSRIDIEKGDFVFLCCFVLATRHFNVQQTRKKIVCFFLQTCNGYLYTLSHNQQSIPRVDPRLLLHALYQQSHPLDWYDTNVLFGAAEFIHDVFAFLLLSLIFFLEFCSCAFTQKIISDCKVDMFSFCTYAKEKQFSTHIVV